VTSSPILGRSAPQGQARSSLGGWISCRSRGRSSGSLRRPLRLRFDFGRGSDSSSGASLTREAEARLPCRLADARPSVVVAAAKC